MSMDITHSTWIKDDKAVDAVYQNGVKVYGRNLALGTANASVVQGNGSAWQDLKQLKLSINPAQRMVTFSYDVTIDKPDSGEMYLQFGTQFTPAWGMPIDTKFATLTAGIKTHFTKTTTFPSYTGLPDSLNNAMHIGIAHASALVELENLSVTISNTELPYSLAPEDC